MDSGGCEEQSARDLNQVGVMSLGITDHVKPPESGQPVAHSKFEPRVVKYVSSATSRVILFGLQCYAELCMSDINGII